MVRRFEESEGKRNLHVRRFVNQLLVRIRGGGAQAFQCSDLAVGPVLGEGSYKKVYKFNCNRYPFLSSECEEADLVTAIVSKEEDLTRETSIQKRYSPIIVKGYGPCSDNRNYNYKVEEKFDGDMSTLMTRVLPQLRRRGQKLKGFYRSFAEGVVKPLIKMHRDQLGHFDLKPDNILFKFVSHSSDPNVTVKLALADFGIATKYTKFGVKKEGLFGTPFYLSPLSAKRGKIRQDADLYSLGMTLLVWFSGSQSKAMSLLKDAQGEKFQTPLLPGMDFKILLPKEKYYNTITGIIDYLMYEPPNNIRNVVEVLKKVYNFLTNLTESPESKQMTISTSFQQPLLPAWRAR